MQYFDVLQTHHKNFWNLYYPYYPNNTPPIQPTYSLTADDLSGDTAWEPVDFFEAWTLFQDTRPAAQYMTFAASDIDARTACTYMTEAGSIDLVCDVPSPQQLIVQEYAFPDWTVTIDHTPATLQNGDFLTVLVPAGVHTITFRYRPWLVIGATGIAVLAWCIGIAMLIWSCVMPWKMRPTQNSRGT
jgi:hypothetical protein